MSPYLTLFLTIVLSTSDAFGQGIPQPAWGSLEPAPGQPGAFVSELPRHDEATKLFLPTPFPHIVRATLDGDALPFEFNEDATQIALLAPAGAGGELRLEIAEQTIQQSDGRIAFSALDREVVGSTAKLETHPGSHRIGFWSNVKDSVSWAYNASRWGRYDVAITYSLASGTSVVEIAMGEEKLEIELPATGSWYRYTTINTGRLYLAKAGKTALTVTPKSKTGGAVMNLKAILLDPAPEGEEIVQDGDEILLRSADATVHGVKLRYEPAEKKNCLGFWANAADWASWDFAAKSPGEYKVLLTQGCGRGHGGSLVGVTLGTQKLEFTVEETGGFQNWKEREIGSIKIPHAGDHRLEVRPVSKKAGAVMDVQKVRLVKLP